MQGVHWKHYCQHTCSTQQASTQLAGARAGARQPCQSFYAEARHNSHHQLHLVVRAGEIVDKAALRIVRQRRDRAPAATPGRAVEGRACFHHCPKVLERLTLDYLCCPHRCHPSMIALASIENGEMVDTMHTRLLLKELQRPHAPHLRFGFVQLHF